MAEFTPDVQGPGSAWMIGRAAEVPDSLLGGIGKVLGNAADKGIDIFKKGKEGSLESGEGDELSQAVRDYANGPQTPDMSQSPYLVGQDKDPAYSDPGFKNAQAEMDTHAAAAKQGAPGAKQALLTRLSEIQSRYATQNPYYAPQLAEYAKGVLGFSANEQLFSVASHAEDFQRSLQDTAQTHLVDLASTAGAVHWDKDGKVDVQATMLAGQQIAAERTKAEAALTAAQVTAAQKGTALTQDQINDQQFSMANPVAVNIANVATNGLFTNLAAVAAATKEGTPIDQARLAQDVGVAQAQGRAQVVKFLDQHPEIGFTTRQNILTSYDQHFEPIKAIMGGDLSSAKQLTLTVQKLKDQNNIDFHQMAPHVAKAIDIGGPQVANTALQNSIAPNNTNPSYERNQKEINNYFNAPVGLGETLRGANGLMSGDYPIEREPNPMKARQVLGTVMPQLDDFANRPHKLSDKEQAVLGNVVRGASAAAVQSGDQQSILNAGTRLVQPGVVQGIVTYANNPANANKAPQVLSYYGQYVQRLQTEAAKVLMTGADTTIVATPDMMRSGSGLGAAHVHYSAAVGPTGQVAPVFAATDARGKSITLSDVQKQQIMLQNPGFRRTMDVYNNSVRADNMIKNGIKDPGQPKQEALMQKTETPQQLATRLGDNKPVNHVYAKAVNDIVPGIRVTSGRRTPEENEADDGSITSMHLTGEAMDFVPPGPRWTHEQLNQFRSELESRGLPVSELMIETEDSKHSTGYHIHWGWGEKNRLASR